MKQRIVLATDSLDPSGMGEHMLTLGEALRDEFDVALAAPEGEHGNRLLRRAATLGLRIKSLNLARVDLFRNWLRDFGAHLVHVHAGIGWEGHSLVRAAAGAGVPVVRTEHLPHLLTDVMQKAEYRAMLLSVDQRIAVSQTVADSYTGQGSGPLQVIRNGITAKPRSQDRSKTRAALGIGDNEWMILTVARFTAQKGHDLLLKAVPAVLQAAPRAKFVLVGRGPEEESFAGAIARQGLDDSVSLLGTRDDVPDLLAAADLFVLPSSFEGLPLALLEAIAASVPVIATAIGGTVEVLGKDHPLLVSPGDAPALAAAIIGALADPDAVNPATHAAAERFRTQFTAARMASETATLYRALLGGPHPQGARV